MEERFQEIEGKLLKVAKITDENTAVMLGGIQTIDVRLAMLFLILEEVVTALRSFHGSVVPHFVHMKGEGIDMEYYAQKAEEALTKSDPPITEKEPATTDTEEVAVYFGGNP